MFSPSFSPGLEPAGSPSTDAPHLEQHVWHHQEQAAARVNVTLEKNTKGYNFAVTVMNCADPDQALDMLEATRAELARTYGEDALKQKLDTALLQLAEIATAINAQDGEDLGEAVQTLAGECAAYLGRLRQYEPNVNPADFVEA